MRKEEFIRRYGEEAYKEHLKMKSEDTKRRKLGLPHIKKTKPINNITVKVTVEADLETNLIDRLEQQEAIASKLQKRLKDWWKKQTDKKFIIVVEYGNLDKLKSTLSYKIELTQLNLHEEEISMFKVGVGTITREIIDNL